MKQDLGIDLKRQSNLWGHNEVSEWRLWFYREQFHPLLPEKISTLFPDPCSTANQTLHVNHYEGKEEAWKS